MRPRLRPRSSSTGRFAAALARRHGLRPSEVRELLERLPFGEVTGGRLPEVWRREVAESALQVYAARQRAVARLARYGRL